MKRLLNVGGGSKATALPSIYTLHEHVLLDIDPRGAPDIVCDARELATLAPAQFDVVYCSHNLEHYYRHDVPKVLAGFLHVLKEDGFAHVRVPDIHAVMRATLERGLDIEDTLYRSAAGAIKVIDVLYGYGAEIESSGQDFYAHKTGFTAKSLAHVLKRAGFHDLYSGTGDFEISALAFKTQPDEATRALFGLADRQSP